MPRQHRMKKRTEVSIADDAANDNVTHHSACYPFLIGQFSAVLLEEHIAHCSTVSRHCVAQYALQVKLAMKLCFSNARAVQQIEKKQNPLLWDSTIRHRAACNTHGTMGLLPTWHDIATPEQRKPRATSNKSSTVQINRQHICIDIVLQPIENESSTMSSQRLF